MYSWFFLICSILSSMVFYIADPGSLLSRVTRTTTKSALSHHHYHHDNHDNHKGLNDEFKKLFAQANVRFNELFSTQTWTYNDTVTAYRTRRGRDPPPGFLQWHARATATQAVIIESFWDLIYQDLEPFRSMSPGILRSQSYVLAQHAAVPPIYGFHITRRSQGATSCVGCVGDVSVSSTCEPDNEPCQAVAQMLQSVAVLLPSSGAGEDVMDLHLAMNLHSSPRVIPPWNELQQQQQQQQQQKDRTTGETHQQRPTKNAQYDEQNFTSRALTRRRGSSRHESIWSGMPYPSDKLPILTCTHINWGALV